MEAGSQAETQTETEWFVDFIIGLPLCSNRSVPMLMTTATGPTWARWQSSDAGWTRQRSLWRSHRRPHSRWRHTYTWRCPRLAADGTGKIADARLVGGCELLLPLLHAEPARQNIPPPPPRSGGTECNRSCSTETQTDETDWCEPGLNTGMSCQGQESSRARVKEAREELCPADEAVNDAGHARLILDDSQQLISLLRPHQQ